MILNIRMALTSRIPKNDIIKTSDEDMEDDRESVESDLDPRDIEQALGKGIKIKIMTRK